MSMKLSHRNQGPYFTWINSLEYVWPWPVASKALCLDQIACFKIIQKVTFGWLFFCKKMTIACRYNLKYAFSH